MIWIFLPAYNEEKALPRLLSKIKKDLSGHPYRVVVVNDGSLDKTTDILKKHSQVMPLDVVTHSINRGLGETERDGYEYIAAHCKEDDFVVRVEGDNTHEPRYALDLLKKLQEGYDVVNTSRFQPGGGQIGVNGYRAFISRAANLFMQIVFGIPGIRDFSCGYRAYRARVIQDAIKIYGDNLVQLRGLGFTSTLEIIVKLHLMGCRFAEVPFVLRYDQKKSSSKMLGSITTLGYLIMGFLYWWPLGGWRNSYKGLSSIYRKNPEKAVEQYSLANLKKHHAVSRIRF